MHVVTRDELESSLAQIARERADPREGIFGPRSVAWQLGGDLAVFLGGGRAALLQLAHPQVAFAVDHHSRARADVVGRFQRTFRHVFAMAFGDLEHAFTAARRVHQIHTRVHGELPLTVGTWRAGTPYHANDADALRWVHATLVDTVVAVREWLIAPRALPLAVKDAFVIEHNRFAALFGIPRDLLPASYREHATYMARMYGVLAVAPCAREMAAFLLGRGAYDRQPVLGRLAEALTAALLPPVLARAYGLERSPLRTRAVRAIAPLYRRLPGGMVALPARSAARRRLAGRAPSELVALLERGLFGLSRQVTGYR